ncbi:hypothetical protein BJP08_09505 [Corynebacterium sp. NML140438]|nr:hypothetical protein BJP08_09505 [Corynebacterium sp. NML140438]
MFLAAVLVFVLPGFVVNVVSGMRVPASVVASIPVSFGIIGLSAWSWGLTSAKFSPWTFSVSVVFAVLCAAGWRCAFARRARKRWAGADALSWSRALLPGTPQERREGSVLDPTWVLPLLGVLVGSAMLISDKLRWLEETPLGLANIVQGWDSQWHANTVRFIMEEGVASPTRMGELMYQETHSSLLYPSGYHAGVALFAKTAGMAPIPALNVAQAIVPSVAACMSVACLVFAFLRSRGLTAQIAAGFAPILVYGAPQLMWVSDYVGMWPYMMAVALTGIVIWQFLEVPKHHNAAFAAAIGFFGVVAVHPSPVTTIAFAVAFAWCFSTLLRPVRSRLVDTVWLVAPAFVGAVLFLPQVFAGSEQAQEVAGWATPEDGKAPNPWALAITMDTRHVTEYFPNYNPTVLLWLALVGAVALVVWRGQVWPVVFYALSLTTVVQAAAPLPPVLDVVPSLIAGLHYNTAHRLVLPVVMCVIAAAAIGLAVIIRMLTLAPVAERVGTVVAKGASTIGAVLVALVVAASTATVVHASTAQAAENISTAPRISGRMVNNNDLAAFDWLATQPAAWEGVTYGEPADGHSWIYAYNGVPTLSRHYLWPAKSRGDDTATALFDVEMLGRGEHGDATAKNAVDRAVERLNIKFYIASPPSFWAQQPPRVNLNNGTANSGLTPVYVKGDTLIFAVNEAFTRAELRAMQRDAVKHGSEPLELW